MADSGDEHEGRVLISETKQGRLYMYWEEYKSQRFLHIRYWFKDKKDGMWKPGVKGIAIQEHYLNELVDGFGVLIEQRKLIDGAGGDEVASVYG